MARQVGLKVHRPTIGTSLSVCACLTLIFYGGIANCCDDAYGQILDAIKQYCQLDALGHRLSTAAYPPIRQLMAWDEDKDEPGWDCMRIISGFDVGNIAVFRDVADATITYTIVANHCSDGELEKVDYIDRVSVKLIRDDDSWKFKDYVPYPRVFISTAIAGFQERLIYVEQKTPNETERIAYFGNLIKELTQLKRDLQH